MITLSDISATKENLMIFRKGKTRVIIARYNLMKSGYGFTAFESDSGGEYIFLNEGYGENWWCQAILKISKDKWDSIPDDYKGRWTEYIRDQGFQPELPDEYIGKRTVFEGCLFDHAGAAVLTEGIHFIIEENLTEQPMIRITEQEALKIVDTRQPRGLFGYENGEVYIGIDNSTGNAWVEEFTSEEARSSYLNGEDRDDAFQGGIEAWT